MAINKDEYKNMHFKNRSDILKLNEILQSIANPDVNPNKLLGEMEACELLSLSVRTLQAYRTRGVGPRFIKLGAKCIRYRYSDLLDWCKESESKTTKKKKKK